MRFLLDANMPRSALRALIAAGHSAAHVRDLEMGRASDDLIDRHAQATGAILVTRDLDFADTRAYPPETAPGRLVLRVADNDTAEAIADLLKRFLTLKDLVYSRLLFRCTDAPKPRLGEAWMVDLGPILSPRFRRISAQLGSGNADLDPWKALQ